MDDFSTVTHTLFFMGKRIQNQMFVYSLGMSHYFLEGNKGNFHGEKSSKRIQGLVI